MIRLLWVLLLWILATGNALAHSSSRSFSTWREDGRTVHMLFSIDQVQATLLIPLSERDTALEALLAGHLAASVKVFQEERPCTATMPLVVPSSSGALQVKIDFTCQNPVKTEGWRVQNNAFFDLASTHIHIAQIENDDQAREFVFTNAHRTHVMRAREGHNGESARHGFWANFSTYIHLGITHILSGFDHLAFVTALILLARNYKDVALLVTGFTLGHSVTLSLAALGIIHPNSTAIEAMIGFSIAFVAMELLLLPGSHDWNRATKGIALLFVFLTGAALLGLGALSPVIWAGLAFFVLSYGQLVTSAKLALRASLALTTAFGLVHGAGFASVLGEAGLPSGQYLAALGGFNIGVEIGQLAVIAAWLMAFALSRQLVGQARTQQGQMIISTIVFTLGIYWFTSRAFI
ncbi:MAG: HupE/UreJ family protein [Robiginitomaculum sp.]|nr:HupE/UreJ family protein [Robiginitomaculum sp.]MDQ7078566.1 HupE/UreJ family protein [Robiginitomaculum sp.]